MQRLAIFASGTGSNAKKIIEYFRGKSNIEVALVVSNKSSAPVLAMAEANGVEQLVLNRKAFYESKQLLEVLENRGIDFIVLAGFLWLIPPYLVSQYKNRMINIHPALLPKYGGKGMYGMNVHRAVKAAGEKETGITIHYVNEHYDEGSIVFQASCPISSENDPEDIAKKVQRLEHRHFAPVIERILSEK